MISVVTAPNPVLRQAARPVEKLDKRIQALISDMSKTLLAAKNPQGVGLAAPQVGIPLRLFLIRPDLRKKTPQVFINPEIIKSSQRQQSPDKQNGVYEGCLSVPDHYSPITRSMSVTVKYQAPNASFTDLISKTEVFTGFPAHVIQHEMDHLNGILFIDRVLQQNTKLYFIKGKTWQEVSL